MVQKQSGQLASTLDSVPLYEWALDTEGHAVHISRALRGETYVCPVCQGKMIAKQGAIKQHHFAHDQVQVCKPEVVAQIAARKWMAQELNAVLEARCGVIMTWPCPLCQHTHTANLLTKVSTIEECYTFHDQTSDIALLDDAGELLGAVLLTRPAHETLVAYASRRAMAIVVDIQSHRAKPFTLETFLAGARIYGGICTTQRRAAQEGVITDDEVLRSLLAEAVTQAPYYIYGLLEDYGDLTHVLTYGDKRLWLPPILWQRAIGGLHHAINPTLQIITQEWRQDDGAMIALYYVTASDTFAVAVRRFAPGEPVYARLHPSVLHTTNLNAVAVARNFAVG